MKKHGLDCVYLDITHQPPELPARSTSRTSTRAASSSASTSRASRFPVVPAAHYTCGGVRHRPGRPHRRAGPVRDRRDRLHRPARRQPAGQQLAARMPGVRARGRAGHRRPRRARRRRRCRRGTTAASPTPTRRSSSRTTGTSCAASCGTTSASCAPTSAWSARRTASRCCSEEIHEYYGNFHVTRDLLELRNLVDVAELIVRSAQARHESRGLHFSRDYPALAASAAPTILVPPGA